MIITREYIYKCRSCGEKFHNITHKENLSPIAGIEPILSQSEDELRNARRTSVHRCLNGNIIGLGDLQGVWTHE